MKKLLWTLAFVMALSGANAQSLGGLLKGLTGGSTSGDNNTDKLSGILNAVGNAVENATATTNFAVEDLIGSWSYESPAVSLSSDNALSTIGGIAASGTIEKKLSPYYNKFGLNKLQIIVNEDLTFNMTAGKTTLAGTISKEEEQLVFNFQAFGKVNIGKINARATKSGTSLNLTFDAQKVLNIAQKVASLANNASLKSVSSLLDSYKGVYVGCKLRKSN